MDLAVQNYFRTVQGGLLNQVMYFGDIWPMYVVPVLALYAVSIKVLRPVKAIAAGMVLTGGLKLLVGRARPYQSPLNPFVFHPMAGLTSAFQSFPSGHATIAFAFAAAMSSRLKGRYRYTLYGLAGLTAVSRIYHDKHWLTDVVMGGVIGYLVGTYIRE